jgi:hypothetical protein
MAIAGDVSKENRINNTCIVTKPYKFVSGNNGIARKTALDKIARAHNIFKGGIFLERKMIEIPTTELKRVTKKL